MATTLLTRIVAETEPRYDKFTRRQILPALRAIGADDLIVRFAKRMADAGYFAALVEHAPSEAAKYPHGREPDGTPSEPWGWSNLSG